jgi:hypothetical protein
VNTISLANTNTTWRRRLLTMPDTAPTSLQQGS